MEDDLSLLCKIKNYIVKNKEAVVVGLCIIGVTFLIICILNSEPMKEFLSLIFGLIFFGLICYFCAGACGRKQQTQSQQIIMSSGESKRVCSECGMQNNVHNIHCSDCGHKMKKQAKKNR